MFFCSLGDRIQPWLRDYDRLQSLAVTLIYIQIACALVGSLGAQYNGVLLINLSIALFALVAIASSSQSLGRTYAVLLFCAILLDISWFILFTSDIWNISMTQYGAFYVFSVRLTLAMQIIGFSVRLLSSFLWIQIYRLGVSHTVNEPDFDLRNSFLSPPPPAVRQPPDPDEVLGGAIYDPAYYSSLFEDGQNSSHSNRSPQSGAVDDESISDAEVTLLKPSFASCETVDEENVGGSPQSDDALRKSRLGR